MNRLIYSQLFIGFLEQKKPKIAWSKLLLTVTVAEQFSLLGEFPNIWKHLISQGSITLSSQCDNPPVQL